MSDLRLLPVAGFLWFGAAIGLHLDIGVMLALIVLAGLVTTLLLHRSDTRLWILALLLGAILAALRVDAAAPDVVRQSLGVSSAATVDAVIDSEPRSSARSTGALQVQERMQAAVTLTRIRDGVRSWQVSIPSTLMWAPTASVPAVGSLVHVKVRLLPDDPARRSVYRLAALGPVRVLQGPSRGTAIATAARQGLARVTGAGGGNAGADLLPGLVLGDTRAETSVLVDDLRLAGLAHLTAVSGANVAIVIGALTWLLARTRMRHRHRAVVLLLTVVAFTVVVQPQPSVVRAAAMSAIGIVAMATGRVREAAAVLWLSIIALLIVDPFLAWQYGFALSVAATGGLIVLRPLLQPHMPAGALGEALVITVSAQIATAPILIAMGRPPTLASIPANLLCEPLVAPATVLGFAAALLSLAALLPLPVLPAVLDALARLVVLPGVWIAGAIARVASTAARSGLAVSPVGSVGALIALALVVLIVRRAGLRWRHLGIVVVTYAALAACGPGMLRAWPQTDWRFAMCDVGQGDATVVRLADGGVLMFDVGPDPRAVRACLQQLQVRAVEALFITHFHADHVEGLAGVVAQAAVKRVFVSPLHAPSIEWRRTRAILPVQPVDLVAGDALQFDDTTVDVLWPMPQELDGSPNNASLVLDVSQRGVHMLVAGDADPAAQARILPWLPSVAVLKVPHHGSPYQDAGFLARAAGSVSLVSVGAGNDYGHPAPATMASLHATGARVWRTDRDGSLAVSVRGRQLVVAARPR